MDQNLFLSTVQALVLRSASINIMPYIIDVDVINGYHHYRGRGGGAMTLNQRGGQ